MTSLLEIKCARCGTVNTLPNLHCRHCGAPLDYAESERRLQAASRPRFSSHALLGYAGWTLLLLLLLALVAALWPADLPRDTSGKPLDARRYTMMGHVLLDAIDHNLSTNLDIAERDVNAFFHYKVAARASDPGEDLPFLSPAFRDAGVHFDQDAGAVWLKTARGPFSLTSEFRFVVAPDGTLAVTSARIGPLPLPGPLGRLYATTRTSLLDKFASESRILRSLSAAELRPGILSVSVSPSP